MFITNYWDDLHTKYSKAEWIDKPSIFSQWVISYLPKEGKLLDLEAGQGQDSRYFAQQEYEVTSTDFAEEGLEFNRAKSKDLSINIHTLDLSETFPYEDDLYDVVYAHLSVHYFNFEITQQLFSEIYRVLKPGGIFAVLTNSMSDPEIEGYAKLEDKYYRGPSGVTKRYFTVESMKKFANQFEVIVADEKGETYKDRAVCVRNLIRFVGKKQ